MLPVVACLLVAAAVAKKQQKKKKGVPYIFPLVVLILSAVAVVPTLFTTCLANLSLTGIFMITPWIFFFSSNSNHNDTQQQQQQGAGGSSENVTDAEYEEVK